jgi:hypothetical protein
MVYVSKLHNFTALVSLGQGNLLYNVSLGQIVQLPWFPDQAGQLAVKMTSVFSFLVI